MDSDGDTQPQGRRTGHVVVAPDKFKGSLTAAEVGAAVAAGLHAVQPQLDIVVLPVADGGDGTLDAALSAGFRRVEVEVAGPMGDPVSAAVGVRERVAVVELALASGLVLLPPDALEPLGANSFGTGQLVLAALNAGCTTIVLGVGGSASTDGGAGLLRALGARLLDADGDDLPLGGGALDGLAKVDRSGLDPRLASVEFILASDVDNPLLGPRGAAAVYGPQKGADPDDVELLEAGLTRWADVLDRAAADRPGAGAAGGVGYAVMAVLGATQRPGIDVVLDLVRFHDQLAGARLVVTGEGRLDEQTLHGKAPAGVAAAARTAGVPVVAVSGGRDLDDDRLYAAGFAAAYACTDIEPDVQRCIDEPIPLLERLGRSIAEEQLSTDT
ncbi:MAG: glycerate kinase [Actinomycetales bacterium]